MQTVFKYRQQSLWQQGAENCPYYPDAMYPLQTKLKISVSQTNDFHLFLQISDF